MAETSKSRVTITLGRSGQVVKRAATVSDVDYSNSLLGAGSKRSVRERLGSSSDSLSSPGSQANNKRQRGDSWLTSLGSNGMQDVRIGKDDLRFKLMQKNVSRRAQIDDGQKNIDLREKLSRTVQPPGPPLSSLDRQHQMPKPKETSIIGRLPPTRRSDDLPRIYSSRSSYSPWNLDHLRRRSPDIVGNCRSLSPTRNVEGLEQRPLNLAFDNVRNFATKPALPTVSAKPTEPPLTRLPPPTSGIIQKSTYPVQGEEQQTVEGLLHSLGLGKYAIHFKAEEVDMTALKQMGENDLKELGIPMGPRKKILLAVLPRSKRQP